MREWLVAVSQVVQPAEKECPLPSFHHSPITLLPLLSSLLLNLPPYPSPLQNPLPAPHPSSPLTTSSPSYWSHTNITHTCILNLTLFPGLPRSSRSTTINGVPSRTGPWAVPKGQKVGMQCRIGQSPSQPQLMLWGDEWFLISDAFYHIFMGFSFVLWYFAAVFSPDIAVPFSWQDWFVAENWLCCWLSAPILHGPDLSFIWVSQGRGVINNVCVCSNMN